MTRARTQNKGQVCAKLVPCKILGAKVLKKNEITAFSTLFNVKKCEKRVMSLEKSSLVLVVIASSSVVSPY